MMMGVYTSRLTSRPPCFPKVLIFGYFLSTYMLHLQKGIHLIIMCFQKENLEFFCFGKCQIYRKPMEYQKSNRNHPRFHHLWITYLLIQYQTHPKEIPDKVNATCCHLQYFLSSHRLRQHCIVQNCVISYTCINQLTRNY